MKILNDFLRKIKFEFKCNENIHREKMRIFSLQKLFSEIDCNELKINISQTEENQFQYGYYDNRKLIKMNFKTIPYKK